jgi:hypothetical protein
LFAAIGYDALYVPATLTGGTGVAYVAYREYAAHAGRLRTGAP